MKKNYRIFTMMLLALTGSASCSDDDNGLTSTGQISFYGENYLLEQGAIYHDNDHTVISVEDYVFEDRYQGENGEQTDRVKGFTATVKNEQTGNFMIGLYEHGFVLSELTKDARGNGACICLRIASSETEQIVPGKYTYSLNRDEYTFKGFSSAKYYSSGDPAPNEFTEGEVHISKEGEIYTITFEGKTGFGGSIAGNYSGKLKTFDIRKTVETVNFYENIKLEALFDTLKYKDLENVWRSEPDYSRATSFLMSSTQQVYTADLYRKLDENSKKGIDIALAYDKANAAVYFESPVKMRALLWHNMFGNDKLFDYSFDLPCHTKYMPAPQDFTNADFEALSKPKDFVFDFQESKTSIPVGASLPYFAFVQTGNGLQGVIRIKEIIPESTEMAGGITYPVNPAIIMDIKFPRSYSEQKIR